MNIHIGPRGGLYTIKNGVKRYEKFDLNPNESSFGKKNRSNETLWKTIVKDVKKGGKGGNPGQWSARKAQLAVLLYKKQGGKYKSPKSKHNSLSKWTRQKWRTKSGKNSIVGKNATGERYLPEKTIKKLSKREYNETTRLKKEQTRKGKQYSKQPKNIIKKIK